MKIENRTPHAVCIADADANIIRVIQPTAPAARVSSTVVAGEPIDGVPFVETVFGSDVNLPEPDGETVYVVSQYVIQACANRTDLVRPDTGSTCVRDDQGRIIAVRAFTK